MKSIAYFSKYSASGPSSRYRAYQFQHLFDSAKIDFKIYPLFEDRYLEIIRHPSPVARYLLKSAYTISRFWNRAKTLNAIPGNPLFVIENQLFPYLPYFCERTHLQRLYLVEFDDAIYLTHPYKFRRVLMHAAGVIAGNRILADYARQFNANVHVIPTVLDTNHFKPQVLPKNERITIGWSGLEYNFKQLSILNDVFLKLYKKYDIRIEILSGKYPDMFSFPFEFVRWESEREASQINRFDIGVMPLLDNEWTRGKCGFKLLQYMACGIAAVASPVGVNSEIIQNGENGFVAVDPDEWEQKLSLLIEDVQLREKIGQAARQTVVEKYSTDVWFPKLLEVYKKYY